MPRPAFTSPPGSNDGRTRSATGCEPYTPRGDLYADIDPDDFAVTFLAALQGGMLLAEVHRDTRPLETTFDVLLALVSAART